MFDSRSSITGIDQEALDELFLEYLELPAHTRASWLSEQCNGEQSLIDEVKSLAQAHEQSGDFLDQATAPRLQPLPQADYSGRRLGSWELQSIIGQGGMGRVYSAERCDGSYQQTAAVKVGPSIGLQSTLFNRERQILANLNHPVITKILDAGDISDSGDAYLVMEFIDGENIVEYVDNNPSITSAERANLIAAVLDALHKAHGQGVIHCDIKPDNILVDKTGQVKLLDFGISKSTHESSADEIDTLFQGITPAYASPQRLMGSTPSTSDDLYGVGLIFGMIIPEKEDRIAQVNTSTNELVPELAEILPAEPRSIFLKATAAETEDRYSSALEFLEDINRWLDHRPVLAFSGGPAYQAGKLFKRHRFLTASAVLLVGVLGTSAFAWQSLQKQEQIKIEQQEQLKSAIQLSKNITEGLDLRMSRLPGSLPVRLSTAETAIQQIEELHRKQPDNPDIKAALVRAYLQLQSFYFQPAQLHIGDIERGWSLLKTAYELAHETYELDPTEKNLTLLAKGTRKITGNLMIVEEDWNATLPFEQELVEEFKSLDVKDSVLRSSHRVQLFVLFRIHLLNGDYEAARSAMDEATKLSNAKSKKNANEFQKNKFRVTAARLKELNAVYSMVVGDLEPARKSFTAVAVQFRHDKQWNDRRRALYAHRSLACIDLIQSEPDYPSAVHHISEAKTIAESLVSEYPNAVSLKWELTELHEMKRFSSQNTPEQANKSAADQSRWSSSFACDNLAFLHMPAPPPEGWRAFASKSPFSLRDSLKSVKRHN